MAEDISSSSSEEGLNSKENPTDSAVSDEKTEAARPISETTETPDEETPASATDAAEEKTDTTDENAQPGQETPATKPLTTTMREKTREEKVRELIAENKKRKQTLAALFIATVAYLVFFLIYFFGYIKSLSFLKDYEFLGVATWLIPDYILASAFLGVILSKQSKHKQRLWFLLSLGVVYTVWLLAYYYQPTWTVFDYTLAMPMWLKPYEYKMLGIWTWLIFDVIIYQIVVIIILTRAPKETRVPWTIFTVCLEYTAWLFLLYFSLTPGLAYAYQYFGPLKPYMKIIVNSYGFLFYGWIALILYNVLIADFIHRAPKHQRSLWTLIVIGVECGMWQVGYFVEIMPMLLRRYEVMGKYTWVYVSAVFFVILIGIILNKAPKVIRQGPILKGLRDVYTWEAALGQLYEAPKGFELLEFPEKKSGSVYSDSLIQVDESMVLNSRTLLGKICSNCDWQYKCKHATTGFLTELPCPPKWL